LDVIVNNQSINKSINQSKLQGKLLKFFRNNTLYDTQTERNDVFQQNLKVEKNITKKYFMMVLSKIEHWYQRCK
jgi:hypothetical protein